MQSYEIQNSEGATLVVQLDDKTAKEIGAKPVTAAKSKTPANKARGASNKKS